MANPFFSIIVPVYKVEQYLNQCINGVLDQTYNDYELILVDDGSPDRCGEMCDSYASSDQRIKVVHKENGGLSSARNAGLDIANGKYIIFLDSDDFWDDRNALEHISAYHKETDFDLLVFPAKRYYGKGEKTSNTINVRVDRDKVTKQSTIAALEYLIENNIYRAAAWNKVIRTSIIEQNKMNFKDGLLSEDMDWCGDLLINCKKFDYYDRAFYCYRQQRKGSITYGKAEKLVSDKLYMCRKGLEQIDSINDVKMRQIIGSYYAYEYSVALGVSGEVKSKDILKEMKKLEYILDYDICNKVKKVNKLRRLIGFTLTRRALCFFVKIKK